ncbi:DHH family phosphoesterase [candidate division KSB1 bacterium]|nr:DHH family phosphoesterase [candidate division KSB1 bacterium]
MKMNYSESKKGTTKLERLLRVIEGKKTALIVGHNNPDPDSIASAMAFQYFLSEIGGIKSDIVFGGIIGRAENRALLSYLNLDLFYLDEVDPCNYEIIALVDTHCGMGNNPIKSVYPVTIEIDHHPSEATEKKALFSDIRESFGATATIMTHYILSAGLKISTKLATALFYAIKAETQDLGREAKTDDRKAYLTLYQLIDFRALAKIQRAILTPQYFQDMGRAIRRTTVFDELLISAPGKVDNPDMVAELADTFLRLQDIQWVIVMGFFGKNMFISVRTNDPDNDAGELVKHAVSKMGTAGGHDMFAGGKIPCENNTKKQWQLKEKIKKRLLVELGFDRRRKGKKLIGMRPSELKSQ